MFDFDGALVDTPGARRMAWNCIGRSRVRSGRFGVVGTRRVVGASVNDGMRSGVG